MDHPNLILAEDVLFEILAMLPVKSLCRFRCVSKSWSSIISDPKFIAAHFERSKSRPKLLISVTRLTTRSHDMKLYSIEYPQEEELTPVLHATAHGSINSPYTQLISASLNGLICCCFEQGIITGNPITGDFEYPIPYPIHHNQIYVRSYLGFDPIDNKQVILKLEDDHFLAKSSVFSLLERQWHNTLSPQICTGLNKSAVSINGVIYFFAWTSPFDTENSITEHGECLYAFDVRLEDFKIIQRPPNPKCNAKTVIKYKDRVALVGSLCMEMKLWILDDPEKQSWSFKSFVLPWGTSSPSAELFGATPRGELMFATKLSAQGFFDLFLYEIDTNTFRRFHVDGIVPPVEW